jgi:acetylornithine deacetylase/succinyl-diaminopimelate desuccinylase-like protein
MPEAWEKALAETEASDLAALNEFLRIPSISALPQHDADVRQAADWMAAKLREAGVPEVELLPTGRNPVLFGSWHVDDKQPTAMIYGHYDVQPPDPLDLWESPPFEPTVRDGKLYARGAADDKGNAFATINAIAALNATQGGPKINLKFFFEGEEEIGSPSLPKFIHEQRDRLACDFVISADGNMFGLDAPSLTMSSKGMASCQINLRTADTDMHSGVYGAAMPNAVQHLVQLAATFHSPDNRVAIEGFYDRVQELTIQERADIAEVPFNDEAYRASVNAPALWGEKGYSSLERAWARPTLDMNGIWGGFQGAGSKTVTPCEAHLKITCRLVPDQDPAEILDLIERHVQQHCPPSATVSVERFPGSAHPFSISRDNPALQAAGVVLGDLYDRDPLYVRTGGTIPVAEIFQQELGADMIFYSFGMPDSRVHAPNESLPISAFKMARRAYCAYLNALER